MMVTLLIDEGDKVCVRSNAGGAYVVLECLQGIGVVNRTDTGRSTDNEH